MKRRRRSTRWDTWCQLLVTTAVIAVGCAASDAAAAGGRKALRTDLEAGLTSFDQALAAAGPVRNFCERELGRISRRFESLRAEILAQPARELDLEQAIARLQELRDELDREAARCRDAAAQEAGRAVDELQRAVTAARQQVPMAAPDPYLVECDELLQQTLPAMLGEGRYAEVMSTARAAARRLEQSVSGGSCEDDFGRAEFQYGTGSLEGAVELFCRLVSTGCLDRAWPERARQRLEQLAQAVEAAAGEGGDDAAPVEPSLHLDADRAAAVAGALAGCMPDRYATLAERARDVAQSRQREDLHAAGAVPGAQVGGAPVPVRDRDAEVAESPLDEGQPSAASAEMAPVAVSPSYLALDVWQSAWGDFSEIEELVAYLRRNHITEVALNPGHAMKPELEREAYEQLRPLVGTLRDGGVEVIRYLYAELGYDVGNYAAFLRRHPDLGIQHLVDDSEFTDRHRLRFETNRDAVRAQGIGYAAFVTVESFGNSGVSDGTRRWAIRNLDQTILMSYFSCTLEGQKADLDPYLSYADRIDKSGCVKIALLMGGKKVGRELSCEQELDQAAFQSFLQDLHAWARTHPSYGGIVIETNRRLPAIDVAKAPLR